MSDHDTNDRDPAEYDEASYMPDMAESDSPEDIIRDAVESVWTGSLPQTKNGFHAQCTAAAIAILRALNAGGKLSSLTPAPDQAKNEPRSLLLSGILAEIIASTTPELTAHCAAFALDLGIIAQSETDIAKRFGVTKGTVSYICRNIVETYCNGNPSHAMKSPEAVKKYARLRKGKCAKQPAAPWEFAATFAAAFSKRENVPDQATASRKETTP